MSTSLDSPAYLNERMTAIGFDVPAQNPIRTGNGDADRAITTFGQLATATSFPVFLLSYALFTGTATISGAPYVSINTMVRAQHIPSAPTPTPPPVARVEYLVQGV